MKQLLCIPIAMSIALLFSLADIDLGHQLPAIEQEAIDSQRHIPLTMAVPYPIDKCPDGCLAVKLPAEATIGTDMSCYLAALSMQEALGNYEVDCLFITNDDFMTNRILKTDEIEYLVALAGAPESRSLEELPCEECPFDKLERCPQCVEVHEAQLPD